MKSLFLLALVILAANSYTLWDNWHNVPTKWTSNGASNTWGLSGWTKNAAGATHYSGKFNNFTQIFTQYLYWSNDDVDTLIICGPKYYLFSETLCRVNPYFKSASMPTYCLPNYFNYDGQVDRCNEGNLLFGEYECCYDNAVRSSPFFEKSMNSLDPYSTPLW